MPSSSTSVLSDPGTRPARRVVVVGAGVSGLAAALCLSRRGADVEVIERADAPGGLAGSVAFRGIACDLGSHRLHPAALALPLFAEMSRDLRFLVRPRRGVLLLGGRRIAYPPTVSGLLRGLGLRAATGLALGLAGRRPWDTARDTARDPAEDVGYERFVRDRVGDAAFEVFYRPYAEKVWGLPAAEISQSVARQRVSSSRPWALLGGAGARSVGTYTYPAEGFGAITSWLARQLAHRGVRVRYNASVDPGTAGADGTNVLFTGALRDLVPTPLTHRGVYFVYLSLDRPCGDDAETYYVPEARYWFGRVANVDHYAPGRVPRGEAVLCVEIPEGRWGRGLDFSTGPRGAQVLGQLVAAGIVPQAASVLDARQVFVPDVYPLYRRGWRPLWHDAVAEAPRLPGVTPFGRQGLFLHCNADHCVQIATAAAEHCLSGGDARAWIAQAERFLSLQVRD